MWIIFCFTQFLPASSPLLIFLLYLSKTVFIYHSYYCNKYFINYSRYTHLPTAVFLLLLFSKKRVSSAIIKFSDFCIYQRIWLCNWLPSAVNIFVFLDVYMWITFVDFFLKLRLSYWLEIFFMPGWKKSSNCVFKKIIEIYFLVFSWFMIKSLVGRISILSSVGVNRMDLDIIWKEYYKYCME